MTLIPTVYNADTLGIRPDLIKRPIDSWAELLNPEFKGKAAILNIPSIGIMDAAMVIEAKGLYKYPDKGNMTKKEIDLTIKTLIEAKKAGQFRALWKDFNESVNLMASGEVVIQSMWSPAVTAVRTKGIACTFQPLKEGYRAWAAGFGVPKTVTGKKADAAYEFINWFLDGWAGAYLNRQGYYSAVLDTAKAKMEAYEWAYWMEGKAATQDIKSPNGDLLAKAGSVRDGGSYEQRMGGIACWNAMMDENVYMVQKWNEFVGGVSAFGAPPPEAACGRLPPGGRRQRPGRAGSAAAAGWATELDDGRRLQGLGAGRAAGGGVRRVLPACRWR